MSIPVFSPITKPDSEQEVNAKPKVQEVVFNDGYIQTAAIGINNDMRTYNPVWTNAYYAEATYIINFLTAKGGWQKFYWTPNQETQQRCFICKDFTYKWKSGKYCDINATFEERSPL